jgi:hypothetical protein
MLCYGIFKFAALKNLECLKNDTFNDVRGEEHSYIAEQATV